MMDMQRITSEVSGIVEPYKRLVELWFSEKFPASTIEWEDYWQIGSDGDILISGDVYCIDDSVKGGFFNWHRELPVSGIACMLTPHSVSHSVEYYGVKPKEAAIPLAEKTYGAGFAILKNSKTNLT